MTLEIWSHLQQTIFFYTKQSLSYHRAYFTQMIVMVEEGGIKNNTWRQSQHRGTDSAMTNSHIHEISLRIAHDT